jgi:hypothetical protein
LKNNQNIRFVCLFTEFEGWNAQQYTFEEYERVKDGESNSQEGVCQNCNKLFLAVTEHQHLKTLIW